MLKLNRIRLHRIWRPPLALSALPMEQALANELFDDASRAALWHRLWSRISGRSDRLETLTEAKGTCVIRGIHFAGARTVPIRKIRGSENRHDDFDAAFRPLNRRVRDRWLSVARALAHGV